ncbi:MULTISPECIES: iron-containing redox enzyme family protein [unclassified Paraburkholderia]|uniref:iron-containing redox enzyme family protein n=1 Tax=unclassified Paraburkholderia TaxID=2615204 RepID=UPI002AB31DB4|nr:MULTISPECIES: iron-containing redox enzyme family protein [unclassified Paraburkholderia]
MQKSRHLFPRYLGAQSQGEVRGAFNADLLRTRVFAKLLPHLAEADFSRRSLANLASAANERLQTVRAGFQRLAAFIETDDHLNKAIRTKAALEISPFVISIPYLLHKVCGSWNNENRFAMSALRIHAADLGVGYAESGRSHRFQELLRKNQLNFPGEDIFRTGNDARISDGAFNFAAQILVVGNFPESLCSEIIGANLYLRQCGLLPCLDFIADDDVHAREYLDLCRNPAGDDADLRALAEAAVQEYLGDGGDMVGVQLGYLWARQQTEDINRNMLAVLERWVDPREAACDLIRRRGADACLYHEKVKLNREPMQGLLAESDEARFLENLGRSAYVRPGSPSTSPLLNSLLEPRGKMFRIFNKDDIEIFRRWIAALPIDDNPLLPPAYSVWKDDGVLDAAQGVQVTPPYMLKGEKPRVIYPRLLRQELSSCEERFAAQYVSNWLARAKRHVAKGHCPLPEKWSPGELAQWLQDQHMKSSRSLEPDAEIPEKDSVVRDILALAPLTMIDGAWLGGFSHPALACTGHGYRLFETFFDELGNGIESQNHPVIYRHLLKAVYGELPATKEKGYADAPCFSDDDFNLPVFWLSIGRYPQTWCAEILGLNLAMELSGVGGGYRRTHRALVKYGYPTLFVDLHNSIDNISTGHTAWAAASLDAYLGNFSKSERDGLWERVRTGFVALNLPKEQTVFEKLFGKMRSIR